MRWGTRGVGVEMGKGYYGFKDALLCGAGCSLLLILGGGRRERMDEVAERTIAFGA